MGPTPSSLAAVSKMSARTRKSCWRTGFGKASKADATSRGWGGGFGMDEA
jgi:hypothetical protein